MGFDREIYASGGAPGEQNDCSVRACAVAACVPYSVAREAFAAAGRRTGRGTKLHTSKRAWELVLGYSPEKVNTSEAKTGKVLTVGQFVAAFPVGHFVVHVSGHAFAVTDGVVHDWADRPRRHVRAAFAFC